MTYCGLFLNDFLLRCKAHNVTVMFGSAKGKILFSQFVFKSQVLRKHTSGGIVVCIPVMVNLEELGCNVSLMLFVCF